MLEFLELGFLVKFCSIADYYDAAAFFPNVDQSNAGDVEF